MASRRRYPYARLYGLSSSASPCDADTRRRLEELKLWVAAPQVPAGQTKGSSPTFSGVRDVPQSFAERIGLVSAETDPRRRPLPSTNVAQVNQIDARTPPRSVATQESDTSPQHRIAVSPPEEEPRSLHSEWERRKPTEHVSILQLAGDVAAPIAHSSIPTQIPTQTGVLAAADIEQQLAAAARPQTKAPSPRSGVILAESLEAELLRQPPPAAAAPVGQTQTLTGHFDAAGIEAELFRNARQAPAQSTAPAQEVQQPQVQAVDAASLERELIMRASKQAQQQPQPQQMQQVQQPQVGGFPPQAVVAAPQALATGVFPAANFQQMLTAQAPVQVVAGDPRFRLAPQLAQFAAVPRV